MKENVSKIAEEYFKPRAWEQKVHRALGAVYAKRLVIAPWAMIRAKKCFDWNNYFIWDTSIKGLKSMEGATRINESIHLVGTLLNIPAVFFNIAVGHTLIASLCVAGTVAQSYLVLIQRYNRARLYSVVEEKEKREKVIV